MPLAVRLSITRRTVSYPYTGSPVYSAPIPINQTTVLKAFAIAPGDLPSFTATSLYTITSGGGGSVNYGLGFTSQGLALRTEPQPSTATRFS